MTVFYRGPYARITHRTFEVERPPRRVFVIRELRHVYVVETGHCRPTSLIAGSSGLAGVAALMVATNGFDVAFPVMVLPLVVLLGVAALGMTGACLRAPARSYELRATYRGEPVLLYATSDDREFGQVKRGLLRALEQVTDT
jgi:hypothetical protein